MANETFCGKCGGCVVLERDCCGDIGLCLNCGMETVLTQGIDTSPVLKREFYYLSGDVLYRARINRGGFSSWLPQGVAW